MTNPAIAELRQMQQESPYTYEIYENDIELLDEAISRIEALGDGWVKCSDRLPDVRIEVLIVVNNEVKSGYYVKSAHGNTEYWYSGGGYISGKINHWMPLPPPPKL